MKKEKQIVESLLSDVGITVNGGESYDPQVHNENFYSHILRQEPLGLGESYMDGWWDCDRLDEFFYKILRRFLGEDKEFQHKSVSCATSYKKYNFELRKRKKGVWYGRETL